jgi:hypothetical protein
MECLMTAKEPDADQLIQNLRATNDRLRARLEDLGQAPPAPVTPELMTGLLSDLLQAAEWLRDSLPPEAERQPLLSAELAEYRRNVERLRDLMPVIQRLLLLERAQLEQKRARLEAAANWAQASRQTL